MALGATAREHVTASDPWAYTWTKREAPALGPYELVKWIPGVEVDLRANPHWYGPKPDITNVIYKQVPEGAVRVALLLSGEAQAARDLSQDELDQVAKSSTAHVTCIAANDFVFVAMNHAPGHPTANLKVRQALAYAVPYADIVGSVYRGRAKGMYGMVPSDYADFLGDSAYPYHTDLARAKQLLAEAGYPNGFKTSLVISSAVPEYSRIAVLLQSAFSKIGVDMSIVTKPQAAYDDLLYSRTFGDMGLNNDHAIVLDPVYHSLVWLVNGPPPNFNWGGFANPEFNSIQAQAVALPEGPERKALVDNQQRIFNEQLPYLPIANDPTCFAFSNNVSGYVWHSHDQVIFSDLEMR
jgi:peptide/nickel transport system substrate-binding protein